MADEVLRLRATVVSDEALANLRALGREIGIVQSTGGKGAKAAAGSWADLGKTIKEVGGGFEGLLGSIAPVGLAIGGFSFAATKAVTSLGDISKKIVELNYASKELGIGEASLRAWSEEAQKAGIAPEAMLQGLGNFKRNTEDFSMRIGQLRSQMIALGAGPVLARINAATTQTDKLKEAFDFKEVLMEADPSGMKARRFFEMLGLGADAARLSYAAWSDTMKEKTPLTPEQIKAAKDYNDALIALGETWDELKTQVGTELFPGLKDALADVNSVLKTLGEVDAWVKEHTGKGIVNRVIQNFNPVANAYGAVKDAYNWATGTPPEGATVAPQEAPTGAAATPGAVTAAIPPAAPIPAVAAQAPAQGASGRRSAFLPPGGRSGPGAPAPTAPGAPPMVSVPQYRRPVQEPNFGTEAVRVQPMGRGGGGADDASASRIITVGVFDALIQFKSYVETGQAVGQPGGIPGLGGGKAGRGGGAPAPGAPPEAPEGEAPQGGAAGPMDRLRLNAEIAANPGLATRLQTIVQGEAGHGASQEHQQVQLETIFNRAIARNQTLDQVTQQYTGPGSGGYYPASTFQHGRIKSAKEFNDFQSRVMAPVMAGSDASTAKLGFAATGNASGGVIARGVMRGKYNRYGQLQPGTYPGQPGVETYAQEETPEQLRRLEASRARMMAGPDTTRIDQAVAPPAATGAVNLTVNSNGTKASADAKTEGGLFQATTIRQHKQMQRTDDAAGGPIA